MIFRARIIVTVTISLGLLFHLFVFKSVISAIVSLITQQSLFHSLQLDGLTMTAFILHIIALIIFISLVRPAYIFSIIDNKRLFLYICTLIIAFSLYMVFNSTILLIDVSFLQLTTQQILLPLILLSVFYLMLILMIRIVSLNEYKVKSEELEVVIDKDKMLKSVLFELAEIVLEVNCTQDYVVRFLVRSDEVMVENKLPFSTRLMQKVATYMHPDDTAHASKMLPKYIMESYEKGIDEIVGDYRSYRMSAIPGSPETRIDSDDFLWYRMHIKSAIDPKNGDLIAVFTFDEVQEEKETELSLLYKAEHDPLTGALNRAAAELRISQHISFGGKGAMIMFDIDNFKGINDNMGHSAGDEVLCDIHLKILAIFRNADIIARVGGDEFLVFLVGALSPEIIEKKAKQLCDTIRTKYTAENGVVIQISCSAGISVCPRDGTSYEDLFNAADIAMYSSKSRGKDTYTLYDPEKIKSFQPQEMEAFQRRHALNQEEINNSHL